MADAEIVKSRLKAIIDFNEIGNGRTVVRKDVLNDALSVIEDLQAEIERLKAQKQKWLQNIADQQLAVSPTGYETEEGLAKRTGEWNGLQMAWEILTKE